MTADNNFSGKARSSCLVPGGPQSMSNNRVWPFPVLQATAPWSMRGSLSWLLDVDSMGGEKKQK